MNGNTEVGMPFSSVKHNNILPMKVPTVTR